MSATTATVTATYEFDDDAQDEVLACLMWDSDFAKSTDGLIKPSFFENDINQILSEIVLEHYSHYKETPSKTVWIELIKENVKSGRIRSDIKIDTIRKFAMTQSLVVRSREWIMDKIAEFAKQRAVIDAMMSATTALLRESDPDRFSKIEKLMGKAFGTSLISMDDDYDYFERVGERTKDRIEIIAGGISKTGITTGIPELDKLLKHRGWGRKEMSLLMGGAKASKSFHLSFFAGRAVQAGYNVLFITLENSKEVLSDRLDAMFSGIGMKDHLTVPNTVDANVRSMGDDPEMGKFRIREFPMHTLKPSDIVRVLDVYKTKGLKFDLLVIDYLDIMAPDHRDPSNVENSKNIFGACRAIAQAEGLALLSCTQTNREGHKSAIVKAEHVAEDFNRIRIADVVLALNRTDDEKAEGKARISFAASRNQADGAVLFVTQDLDMGLAIARVDSVE